MKLREILSKKYLIDKSVAFLGKKTNAAYESYESIEDCHSNTCEEEKDRLRKEMSLCINKLRLEEKELDKCERNFHDHSGQVPTPTPEPAAV